MQRAEKLRRLNRQRKKDAIRERRAQLAAQRPASKAAETRRAE